MPSPTHAAPPQSLFRLSFGNGHCGAVYDTNKQRITHLREHLYRHASPGQTTANLAFDAYFGLRAGGSSVWFGEQPLKSKARYEPGTGVVVVEQEHNGVKVEQYFFSPYGLAAPALVMLAKVTSSTAQTVDLFSIHNFHLGGGNDATQGEQLTYNSARHAYVEKGSSTGRTMLIQAVGAPTFYGASPKNPYQRVKSGQALENVLDSGVTNDAVSGYQWTLSLVPNQPQWRGVVIAGGRSSSTQSALEALVDGYVKSRGAEALHSGELAEWSAWHQSTSAPKGASPDELAVFEQAVAILRMGQSREAGKAFGQIVASMPPGMWDIAWVRDAAYAIAALARSGHPDEARDGLKFMLEGEASKYVCCDKDGGPYVGVPYAISVTRYYGDGTEESDWNQDGPNVEFDNFGLFLWSLGETIDKMDAGEAKAFLNKYQSKIFGGTADVLVSLLEPSTGLLRADSSIWEHHWDNGARRHHTYSDAVGVAGLRAAAKMARLISHAKAADYDKAAQSLAQAIQDKLVDPATKILASDLESLSFGPNGFIDAAVVEAINHSVIPPKGAVATATLGAFDTYLKVAAGTGYKRNDDGDAYDEREWVIIDLRIASARFLRGEHAIGQALVDWVTGMARNNFDLVPELLDQTTSAYFGEIPMVGFGAGTYALALFDRAAAQSTPAPDAGPANDGGADSDSPSPDAGPSADSSAALDSASSDGGNTAPGGDGCSAAGAERGAGTATLLALLLGLAITRRRWRAR